MWNVSYTYTTHTSLYFNRSLTLYMCCVFSFLPLLSLTVHCLNVIFFFFFLRSLVSFFLFTSLHFSLLFSLLLIFATVCISKANEFFLMMMMKLCAFGTVCVRTMCNVYYEYCVYMYILYFAFVSHSTITIPERQMFAVAACYSVSEC